MPDRQDIVIYDQLSFLKRRFRTRLRRASGPVNAAPLADLVLILMMFWVMNSWHVLKPGVYVNLPEAPFVSGVHAGALVITLSREGLVFFNDERTTLEGLRNGLAGAARDWPDAPVVIEADERVDHGAIVRIYHMALEAGVREVAIATRPAAPMVPPRRDTPEVPETVP